MVGAESYSAGPLKTSRFPSGHPFFVPPIPEEGNFSVNPLTTGPKATKNSEVKFWTAKAHSAKSAVQVANLREPGMLGTPFTIPTALDNMDASNPFLKSLAAMPIADGVHAHSIIPVQGTGPVEDGNDGVNLSRAGR